MRGGRTVPEQQAARKRKTDRSSRFTATWDVPYQTGELKAIGYRAGKQVGSAVLKTAQEVSQITVTADGIG